MTKFTHFNHTLGRPVMSRNTNLRVQFSNGTILYFKAKDTITLFGDHNQRSAVLSAIDELTLLAKDGALGLTGRWCNMFVQLDVVR
jgi:hypothetical protein